MNDKEYYWFWIGIQLGAYIMAIIAILIIYVNDR
jgi:hypothetical protein